MNLFNCNNYRSLITKVVSESKGRGQPLTYKSLAETARIQAPYLTKVVNGQAELSQDQTYLMAQGMGLNLEEESFFSLLVEYERSGVAERKKRLKNQIDQIRDRQLKVQRVVKVKSELALGNGAANYHLDIHCQIIHMALTISTFAKNPKKLCDIIDISANRLYGILNVLRDQELIVIDTKGSVLMLKEHLHLPSDSPLFQSRQAQLRAATSYRALIGDDHLNHSFQVMFSADANTAVEIKLILNEALSKIESIVKEAPAEGVYQFGFDFSKWI